MAVHSKPSVTDQLVVDTPEGLRALADPTRSTILSLLQQGEASVTQLAAAMDKPKGTVAHHVGVLEDAGLVQVVRTRKVRAMTERFYARTAHWFMLGGFEAAGVTPDFAVREALSVRIPDKDRANMTTARYARIPEERAAEFADELIATIDRFVEEKPAGDTVYSMVIGVFPTTRPTLDAEE